MFRQTITTSIDIDAPAGQLWQLVGTLECYAGWNSATVFRTPAKAGRIQLMRVKLGGLWLPVPVLIQHCDQHNGLRWIGGIPGLITGSHYFCIEPVDAQRSRLVQGEDFTGLLVPLLLPLLGSVLNSLYSSINHDVQRKLSGLHAH